MPSHLRFELGGFFRWHWPHFLLAAPGALLCTILHESAHAFAVTLQGGQVTKFVWLPSLERWGYIKYQFPHGNAYWQVKDILELSNVGSGVLLIPDGCLLNGEVDSEIVVVDKDEIILLAWRANTTLDVFEVIPTDRIECHSDKAMTLE